MSTTKVAPTEVIVRLAAELLVDGLVHPVAAAVAQAARMHALAAPEAFAERLGVDELTLRRAERGRVAFDRLPAAYLAFVDGIDPTIDLVGLRALAAATDGAGDPVEPSGIGELLTFPGRAPDAESVA